MKKNLLRGIVSLMQYVEGQNNYTITGLSVQVCECGIIAASYCENEYGGYYPNFDTQHIRWADIPNWIMKKLIQLDEVQNHETLDIIE